MVIGMKNSGYPLVGRMQRGAKHKKKWSGWKFGLESKSRKRERKAMMRWEYDHPDLSVNSDIYVKWRSLTPAYKDSNTLHCISKVNLQCNRSPVLHEEAVCFLGSWMLMACGRTAGNPRWVFGSTKNSKTAKHHRHFVDLIQFNPPSCFGPATTSVNQRLHQWSRLSEQVFCSTNTR